MLFVLGGNGTHAGANAIHNEVVNPLALHQLIAAIWIFFLSMLSLSCGNNILETYCSLKFMEKLFFDLA